MNLPGDDLGVLLMKGLEFAWRVYSMVDPVVREGGISEYDAEEWPWPKWFDGTPVRRMRAGHLVNSYRQAKRWANGNGRTEYEKQTGKQPGLEKRLIRISMSEMWAEVLLEEILRRWPDWLEREFRRNS